jgi:hypothetical protein
LEGHHRGFPLTFVISQNNFFVVQRTSKEVTDDQISNDDCVPLVERLFGMIGKQIEAGDYDEEALITLFGDLEAAADRVQSNLDEKLKELGKRNATN